MGRGKTILDYQYLKTMNKVNFVNDSSWLKAMIKHHKIALEMSEEAIKNSDNEYIIGLAKDIIKGQSIQIHEMEKHL